MEDLPLFLDLESCIMNIDREMEDEAMRIYADDDRKEPVAVICNRCKKELRVEKGIVKEGCFCGDARFGYFSNKDGMEYCFDLCEECYDKMISGFAIPVEKREVEELL